MIQLPIAFREIVNSNKNNFVIYGGRLGGKSNGTAIFAIKEMLEHPYTDVIVARASYGSIQDSSYAELINAIEEMGDDIADEFILKKSPLRIERKGDAGSIYFIGYGGSNKSRTKGLRTKHPVKVVIMEETQELREERSLDEAMASFRRRYGKDVKVFVLFNPPPQEAHWINKWLIKKQRDSDWLCKRITWQDIVPFINDYDLKEILKTKQDDELYYNWFYMGETVGGFGSVYPMFRKEKFIISPRELEQIFSQTPLKIVACIIGGDGAVNRDASAFVPILLLNNGQTIVGDIFFHNPKDDGVISYHALVQDHLTRWFDRICQMYHLVSRQELREAQYRNVRLSPIPIYMVIDSAAPDLIAECRLYLSDRCEIYPVKKRAITEMVGICQSTISASNMYIVDYGGYYDYMKNRWVKADNILAEQISMLIWNEKQTGYDPIVPNDVCDAWTYGNVFWFAPPENNNYLSMLKLKGITSYAISDIIKK